MKTLVYLLGVTICTTILTVSCSKQNDRLTPQANEANLKGSMQYTICHLDDDGTWIVITVNENALPGHMAHGDEFYWEFPEVAVYNWNYTLADGLTHMNTMTVTYVDDESFEGYGTDNFYEGGEDWVIDNGTINGDGSVTFTVNYNDSGIEDFVVMGSFECGIGIGGSIYDGSGNLLGSWSANYGGGIPEESGLTEVHL
jgi:hypothetical protein